VIASIRAAKNPIDISHVVSLLPKSLIHAAFGGDGGPVTEGDSGMTEGAGAQTEAIHASSGARNAQSSFPRRAGKGLHSEVNGLYFST
jgi:hypothetical protein